MHPPFLRIAQTCILQSPNRFIFGEHFFRIQGVPRNNKAPAKNCPGDARLVKLDAEVVESPADSGLTPKLMTQSVAPKELTELTMCQGQQLNLPLVRANM